jgi:molybdopterin/thiamine biosynthesis adenylyltransferase
MTDRYARQIRLAEVGEAGQRRIRESTCIVQGSGLAAEVEARYLAGSGLGHLLVSDAAVARSAREVNPKVDVVVLIAGAKAKSAEPEWLESLSSPAREVALGAYRALSSLRCALQPSKQPL